MSALSFEVQGAEPVPFALVPTLAFRLRITGGVDRRIESVLLRCQIRVEPERRRYDGGEKRLLSDVFGEPQRWGGTVKPFLWTHVNASIGRFEGETKALLHVECSYDLEVTAGKYFHALGSGDVPLLLLFRGTVFTRAPEGLRVSQIPWDREARWRLPVSVWRELMDAYFPGAGWLRLDRETIDALAAYKARHALATWDDTVRAVLTAGAGWASAGLEGAEAEA